MGLAADESGLLEASVRKVSNEDSPCITRPLVLIPSSNP